MFERAWCCPAYNQPDSLVIGTDPGVLKLFSMSAISIFYKYSWAEKSFINEQITI